MHKKIIGGNWKLNYDHKIITRLTHHPGITNEITEKVDIFLAVPYVFIQNLSTKVPTWISVGAQDCSIHKNGEHTGEVSAEMLKSVGCRYVIVGHSERRHKDNCESNNVVYKKLVNVIDAGMCPVLCVGETERERDDGMAFDTIETQLRECLFNIKSAGMCVKKRRKSEAFKLDIIVAYEPVWAIGTGKTAYNDDVEKMILFIKKILNELDVFGRVIYGGSVNAKNVAILSEVKACDGFLVGKASMCEDFFSIIKETSKK